MTWQPLLRQLRPHWERIQEQTRAVERVRQHSDEVNARLQRVVPFRASVSAPARIDTTQPERHRAAIEDMGWRNTTASASGAANWRGGEHYTTIPRSGAQLSQWQQQLLSDTRQRDALPPLTLDLTPQALA